MEYNHRESVFCLNTWNVFERWAQAHAWAKIHTAQRGRRDAGIEMAGIKWAFVWPNCKAFQTDWDNEHFIWLHHTHDYARKRGVEWARGKHFNDHSSVFLQNQTLPHFKSVIDMINGM